MCFDFKFEALTDGTATCHWAGTTLLSQVLAGNKFLHGAESEGKRTAGETPAKCRWRSPVLQGYMRPRCQLACWMVLCSLTVYISPLLRQGFAVEVVVKTCRFTTLHTFVCAPEVEFNGHISDVILPSLVTASHLCQFQSCHPCQRGPS